ncbi:MAG: YdcF family protein [Faecalibacterium sp.]|nr:YdcF family protein [Ruminococcus sp.]MCM1392691.1 YdcF family protein [Ruminococcus sp.]MCM1484816.1 YdcF family protein [Faecalibacterium sp.]
MKKHGKMKKILLSIIIAIIAVGIYALSVNFYIIGSAKSKIMTAEETAQLGDIDCVLVLGCGVKADGTPSHMLYERLKTGADVFEKSNSKTLLLTGDNSGERYNELAVMKSESIKNGVDEADMTIDDFGFSTYESLYNAKTKYNVKRIIIITQSYHMPRALYIAKTLGIEAYGVNAWLPLYPAQVIWSTREVLARNKDFLKCIADGI